MATFISSRTMLEVHSELGSTPSSFQQWYAVWSPANPLMLPFLFDYADVSPGMKDESPSVFRGDTRIPSKPNANPTRSTSTDTLFDNTYGGRFFGKVYTFPTTDPSVGTVLSDHVGGFVVHNSKRTLAETITVVQTTGDGSEDLGIVTVQGGVKEDISTALPKLLAPLTSEIFEYTIDANGPTLVDLTVQPYLQSLRETFPIRLLGRRSVVFPFAPQTGLSEKIQHRTNILLAKSGAEQRISERKTARQEFRMQYMVDSADPLEFQRIESLLTGLASNPVGVGLWQYAMKLASPVSVGDPSIEITEDTSLFDIRDGGYVLIWSAWDSHEVVQVSGTAGTTITANQDLGLDWDAGTYVVPLQLMVSGNTVEMDRYRNDVTSVDLTWQSQSWTELLDDSSAWCPNTYLGLPLMEDAHFLGQGQTSLQTSLDLSTTTLDTPSSQRAYVQDMPSSISFNRTWYADTKQQVLDLRKLAYGLRGRQKSFWIPSYRHDMVSLTDGSGASSFLIDWRAGYSGVFDSSSDGPYNNLRIEFTDGTVVYRAIESIAPDEPQVTDRVTLTEALPTLPGESIARVSFLFQMRQADDTFDVIHTGQGSATATCALVGVRK